MRVVFSIDGLEDTNEIYRIGVKWDKLIANVKAFIAAGGSAEWDFLVFKHNQHQVDQARQLADQMGFIRFNQGNPHGFKYNDKIRVVDRKGKFKGLIERNTIMQQPTNDNPNLFDDIEYDMSADKVTEHFVSIYKSSTDATHEFFDIVHERLSKFDSVEIKECMCKDLKEIYVDADGGIHPCCFLGHISQKYQQIHEMMLHRQWIEQTIGMDNINALKRPLKDIIDSDYFYLIEDSWSKTFAEGRNPVCVLKCGVQRPNNQIKR